MRYKLFGKSGLRVSELCLGTMTFGEEWGWGTPKEECHRIFETFAEAGGNFIDTANKYTDGTSETIVGDCIAADRERFVVATKYTLSMNPKDPNACGNHRKNMKQALEASLRRLKTNYIDLYWVHTWDFMTPTEEVMRGLDDLVRLGKVLYVGISDAPAWIVSRANTMAELRGWTPFVGLQIQYSLVERTPERELLPMARALDLAVTPWGPLGVGVLTGKFNKDADRRDLSDSRLVTTPWGEGTLIDRNFAIAEEVGKVAAELGRSSSQVALAWLRQQPGVIIPLFGARTLSQLEDNLGCLDFELSEKHMHRLNEVSKITKGFPHDFLELDDVKSIIYGETLPLIDRHGDRP